MTHPLLEQAQHEGHPLIQGNRVTFLWEGDAPPAVLGDFNLWGQFDSHPVQPMTPLADKLWSLELTLPADAYFEYVYKSLVIEEEDLENGLLPPNLDDPLNTRKITNGMGGFHYFFNMPEARHTPLVKAGRKVARGKVTRHKIDNPWVFAKSKGPRDCWLYAPPTEEPAHLLVVLDGRDYLERAGITEILDNMFAYHQIGPVALAMIDSVSNSRMVEYQASDATISALGLEIVPLAQRELNLIDIQQQPGAYGILGASMGGLMALYAGLRLPHLFGHIISQSGAFNPNLPVGAEPLITELIRYLPKRDLKIWQDVGQFERLLDINRTVHPLLVEKGYEVTYREFPGGHNFTSWRDQLPAALQVMFGIE